MPPTEGLAIGVSQCLLGDPVRYDGGHKANSSVIDLLAPHFNLVPVCPEVESGMGVPREAVQLRSGESGLRMVGMETQLDYTDALSGFAIKQVADLAGSNLCGYVFKSKSPSCGLKVDVQDQDGQASGLFAAEVVKAFPDLPVIEESELNQSLLREGFVERIFAYSRLALFFSQERSVGQLAMAHAQVKLQLDVHDPAVHEQIQQLFKRSAGMSYLALCDEYRSQFMEALREPATVPKHFEVLKGIFTHIKPTVEPPVIKDLARSLQDYRLGIVPLSVPLCLLRHYVRVKDLALLNGQTYLDPEPRELLLRIQI